MAMEELKPREPKFLVRTILLDVGSSRMMEKKRFDDPSSSFPLFVTVDLFFLSLSLSLLFTY